MIKISTNLKDNENYEYLPFLIKYTKVGDEHIKYNVFVERIYNLFKNGVIYNQLSAKRINSNCVCINGCNYTRSTIVKLLKGLTNERKYITEFLLALDNKFK